MVFKKGFFDPSQVKNCAAELHARAEALKLDNSFSEAWAMYHDSFSNNQDEVLDAIYRSFFKGVQYIAD